jgi:hypothetical protein
MLPGFGNNASVHWKQYFNPLEAKRLRVMGTTIEASMKYRTKISINSPKILKHTKIFVRLLVIFVKFVLAFVSHGRDSESQVFSLS